MPRGRRSDRSFARDRIDFVWTGDEWMVTARDTPYKSSLEEELLPSIGLYRLAGQSGLLRATSTSRPSSRPSREPQCGSWLRPRMTAQVERRDPSLESSVTDE